MSLIILIILTVFLATYTPVSVAAVAVVANDSWSVVQWFMLGAAFGSFITLMAVFFISQQYRFRYQKMIKKLQKTVVSKAELQQKYQLVEQEQQDSQDMLEERVQGRTLELNIALQELEQANEALEKQNTLDELTGLFNRRFYEQKIMAEYRRSKRNLMPLSLIMIDIDHFKNVNDTYGHLAGDHCLMWLSQQIKLCLRRGSDMGFRYGGEEFCLILPDTDSEGAFKLSEILRKNIEKRTFSYQETIIKLTISCGVSTYQQENDVLPEQLFIAADTALYQAKNNGRNQSQLYQFTQQHCSTEKQS